MRQRKSSRRSSANNRGRGFVRIIGGEWRGRRLPVVDAPGLRPTGDRVRETLFNWLQGELDGARCADLFAGTGVLGFEAASRGAQDVVLVEKSAEVAAGLRESVEMLGAQCVRVVRADALRWLKDYDAAPLDVVFVDPPFDSCLAAHALELLALPGRLRAGATVYVERPANSEFNLPGEYRRKREKRLGEVHMELLESC